MKIKQYGKLADALVFVHGEKARQEAMRMADLHEKTGDIRAANDWRETVVAVAHRKTPEIQTAA